MADSRCKTPANRLRLISHYHAGSGFNTHAHARAYAAYAHARTPAYGAACTNIWTHTLPFLSALLFFSPTHTHTHSLLRWHPPASCHCLSINSCNHIHRRWTRRRALCCERRLLSLSADCWFHGLKWQPPLADSISCAREVIKEKKHTVFTYEVNKALCSARCCRGHFHSAPIQTQGGYAWKWHPACHALIINNNKSYCATKECQAHL